jgi:hypothetical protein
MAAFIVLNFSINTLTLFAMVLAIGLVVDDAIVVIENVEKHMEEGLEPIDAIERGGMEVYFLRAEHLTVLHVIDQFFDVIGSRDVCGDEVDVLSGGLEMYGPEIEQRLDHTGLGH